MEQDTNLGDQASRKEVVVRKKKDTAKGLQHKKELSEKRFNKSKRKLENQLTVLNKIVEQWSNQSEEVANSARFKLESLHSEFMENLLKQRELVQEDTQTYAELNEMANQFDEMVFEVGNKVSQLQRQSMTSDHHFPPAVTIMYSPKGGGMEGLLLKIISLMLLLCVRVCGVR